MLNKITKVNRLYGNLFKLNKRFLLIKNKLNENDELNLTEANKLKTEGIKISLESKYQVSKSGYVLRFLLPNSNFTAHFKTCQYLFLEASIEGNGKSVKRPYHPISLDTDKGFVDFFIKVYDKKEDDTNFGLFSNYLINLEEGEVIKIFGPFGNIIYNGLGEFKFNINDHESIRKVKKIGMIAGGSGITPLFQLITKIMSNKFDRTGMSLVYCAKSFEDIFFCEDFINFDKKGKLVFYPVVEFPEKDWIYGNGLINEDMIKNYMPSPQDKNALIFLCGPRMMIESHLKPLLKKMNYSDQSLLSFH